MDEWLAPFYVDESFNGLRIQEGLDRILEGTEMSYFYMFDYAVILVKDPQHAIERQGLLRKAAMARKRIEEQVIGDIRQSKRGVQLTLSGTVTNESNDSHMAGVVVRVNDKVATNTDQAGHYNLKLAAGEYVVSFQYVNFVEKVISLGIYDNGALNISLEETPTMLEEVVISDQAIVNAGIGQTTLQMKELKRAPAFLGEIDVIKQLQTQAGVTSVGEVATGFNVRGGSVDQNLILYDGTPIFNTSHALGFFTAFNSEIIDKVKFYRAGIPAEYGGRVSSVLSMTSREGSSEKWHGSAGIGIISSHADIGGPIKRDTTTLLASLRTSYSNWMLKAIQSNYQNLSNSAINFYDGSLKLAHKFNANTKLVFSGYTSHDQFSLSNDTLYNWNNLALSLRLDKTYSSRLFSSFTLAMGQYGYIMQEHDPENAFDLSYKVTYPSLKLDFNRNGEHELAFGFHNTYYNFQPGHLKPTSGESSTKNIEMLPERSVESALYASDGFFLRENLFAEVGLRLSMFTRFGPGKVYSYAPGEPLIERNVVDSTQYGNGDIMKTYYGLEPRATLRYTLNPNSSIKFAYNRVFQYLHMITNTAAVTPVDIWQSSNAYFKPQVADQVSLGYYRNVSDNTVEMFVEGYYKHVQNILDFKDGSPLILNNKLETALLKGVANSYGVEFSATKIKGRLQGAFNYTYSRSFRQVNGATAVEKINDGNVYRSNYDQPNVVNMNWRYGVSRRIFVSGNFTYHTGRPISYPVSVYRIGQVSVAEFSYRNQYRLPDYHRLDLALVLEGTHRRKKILDGSWIFSIYNAYARKNVYSVFFVEDNRGKILAYRLSVVGTMIPSISYNVKF